jgi:tetratricopeptide (TPR) repeat protein
VDSYVVKTTDSAARHLLHNLRNATALRGNPLVSHLLESPDTKSAHDALSDRAVVSRVAQAVAAVLRTLAPADGNPFDDDRPHRQAEIIRRCVLGNEPYKAVAHDLGISLRTLFRDLDGIRLHLVDELPRYSFPAPTIADASDMFELELRHAHMLRNMGRFGEALEVLDRLVADASDPLQRARAWNTSAGALVDSGATDQASLTVGRARAALTGIEEGAASTKALVESDVDLTDGMIARVKGQTAAAIESYSRAADLSRPLLPGHPASATDVYVRALAQSATIHWLVGDIQAASAAVDAAWTALERIGDPPEAAHYSLLSASALVHVVCSGDIAWAIREMSAAAVLAERHGMLHDALMALGWLSSLENMNGNLEGALATSRRTISIARGSMAGTEFGLLCAAFAETEAEAGNIADALRLIEEGRSRVTPGGSGWARLQLGEASVLLAAGRSADAIAAARKAADAMQRQGKAGFVGHACLITAKAHLRKRETAEALLATREALPLLEHFGKTAELAEAYALSAQLTGNRSHRSSARDLAEMFKR